jgi:hypothetical protein
MKKILLIALSIPTFLFAQDVKLGKELTDNKKLKYGLYFAPECNISSIKSSIYNNQTTVPTFGFSAGVLGEYVFSKKFSMKLGLGYGNKKNKIEQKGLIFESDLDPVTGIAKTESRMETIFLYYETNIQILAQITSTNKRFYATAGIDLGYIFKKSHTVTYYFGNGLTSTYGGDYNRMFNMAPVLGLGYNFLFKNKRIISVEPTFRYYLNNYGDKDLTELSLLNVGIKTTFWF